MLLQVVRDKIKGFAANAVGAPAPGYPSPPYKVLPGVPLSCRRGQAQGGAAREPPSADCQVDSHSAASGAPAPGRLSLTEQQGQ